MLQQALSLRPHLPLVLQGTPSTWLWFKGDQKEGTGPGLVQNEEIPELSSVLVSNQDKMWSKLHPRSESILRGASVSPCQNPHSTPKSEVNQLSPEISDAWLPNKGPLSKYGVSHAASHITLSNHTQGRLPLTTTS